MTQEQDRQFVRTFTIVIVALAGFGIAMVFLARAIHRAYAPPAEHAAVAERIAPVGRVNTGEPLLPEAPQQAPAAGADGGAVAGAEVYTNACAMCHAQGVAGAPRLGDEADWGPRIEQGLATLYRHAIEGFQGEVGVMPPKGGRADLSDEQVKAAVRYMYEAAGGDAGQPQAASQAVGSGATQAPAETAPAAGGATPPASPQTQSVAAGEKIYDTACGLCHTTGAAGAPKLGNAEDWAARIDKGMDVLYDHAINGFMGERGLMPPKGGRADLSDEDVKSAVAYMVERSR